MHTKLDYLCKLTHVDYVLSGSVNPDYSDEFNVTKIKIINNLYDKKEKYLDLFENVKNSSSLNELISHINDYLKKNEVKSECEFLIKIIQQVEDSKLNDKYEIKEIHDHFYPIAPSDKCAVEVSSVSGAGNPFDTPLEVEKLLELYQSNVVKKYKGEKNIGLGGDIFTVEAFCRELNKIHEFVKSKLSSSLKPILTSFAKSDEVRDIIRIQKKIVFSIS